MKLVNLTNSSSKAIVSDADFRRVNKWNWYVVKGYAKTCAKIKGKWYAIYLHRFILKTPPGIDTDHKNHNKLDNRRGNLRLASRGQNNANRLIIKHPHHTSRFKGVFRDKERGGWIAKTAFNSKHVWIGRFKTEVQAAIAYNKVLKRHFKNRALLNPV